MTVELRSLDFAVAIMLDQIGGAQRTQPQLHPHSHAMAWRSPLQAVKKIKVVSHTVTNER